MATALQNLSHYNPDTVPGGEAYRFAVIVAEWNSEVTMALMWGAVNTLQKHGVPADQIRTEFVPGTFELTLGAQLAAERSDVDAVIVLGCVIQGETRHFDFICQGVTYGITEVNLKYNKPVIFGVLTTDNQEQALDRAGGKHGNKGDEAAITALKMLALKNKMK
jgi:6,7-dimethyl-8-ribityllumazine synthase